MKPGLLAVAAAALGAVSVFAADVPDGSRWWSYVQFLASDKLEGRNTGSEGRGFRGRRI